MRRHGFRVELCHASRSLSRVSRAVAVVTVVTSSSQRRRWAAATSFRFPSQLLGLLRRRQTHGTPPRLCARPQMVRVGDVVECEKFPNAW